MLQQKNTTPQAPSNKPLWTQDEAISYECAREVINDMVGICSFLLGKEEKKAPQNPVRIEELNSKITLLFQQRNAINWQDHSTIMKVRKEYGAKVRAYREGGECPV